jgi:hypothetical protein
MQLKQMVNQNYKTLYINRIILVESYESVVTLEAGTICALNLP